MRNVAMAASAGLRSCGVFIRGHDSLPGSDEGPEQSPTAGHPQRLPLTLTLMPVLQELKSFWLPSLAPESKAMVDKPDAATHCPATGKKLRLKDLTPVSCLRPAGCTFERYAGLTLV